MASIPPMKSAGASSLYAIAVSLLSHSAVRAAEVSASGSTTARFTPSFVGMSCLPFRSAKPVCTSFSMMAARVAGVPNPLRCVVTNSASLRPPDGEHPFCAVAPPSPTKSCDFAGTLFSSGVSGSGSGRERGLLLSLGGDLSALSMRRRVLPVPHPAYPLSYRICGWPFAAPASLVPRR